MAEINKVEIQCNLCNKHFKSAGNKKKHDKEYHAKFVWRFSCSLCGLSNSPNPYIILNHHKISHANKPAPFIKDIAAEYVPNPKHGT